MLRPKTQTKYVKRNIEAPSCKPCCGGKAISITDSECVFVDLGIQHALSMTIMVTSGLQGLTILFHIISQTAQF